MRPPEAVRAGASCVSTAEASGGVHDDRFPGRPRPDLTRGSDRHSAQGDPASFRDPRLRRRRSRVPRFASADAGPRAGVRRAGDRQVRSLRFVGNKTFDDGQLSANVVTTASSFAKRYFRVFGTARCYPADGLAQDTSRISSFSTRSTASTTRASTPW